MLSRSSTRPLYFWFFFQLSIFQVTCLHHWSKVDFSFVSLRLQDILFLASDLSWIEWYFHSDLFFSCQRFIYYVRRSWLQFPGSYWIRKHTSLRNIVSFSLSKALSVGTKHRRYRASCWLTTAASGFLIRDLLWNTQWCSFLVIVHLLEDRFGFRLVVEINIGLMICVWGPVDQSDSLWGARLMRCTVRRFSDTLSCNGSLRTYLSFCSWFEFECMTLISKSQGSRTGIPSIRKPVSTEIISASVELCDTHVCFLHIQLIGTNVWLPNTHNVPPEVAFESFRFRAVSKSWNSHILNFWSVFPTWQYWLYSLVKWMQEIKRTRQLSQALTHFVIARASLLTVHEISGLSIRVKYRISGKFESIQFVTFSYGFQFFFIALMVIKTWSWFLMKLLRSLDC